MFEKRAASDRDTSHAPRLISVELDIGHAVNEIFANGAGSTYRQHMSIYRQNYLWESEVLFPTPQQEFLKSRKVGVSIRGETSSAWYRA
jgi:hypothetical protein